MQSILCSARTKRFTGLKTGPFVLIGSSPHTAEESDKGFKMPQNSETERQVADLEELRRLHPGLSAMDYKAALRHAKTVAEAAEWLSVKRRSHI